MLAYSNVTTNTTFKTWLLRSRYPFLWIIVFDNVPNKALSHESKKVTLVDVFIFKCAFPSFESEWGGPSKRLARSLY